MSYVRFNISDRNVTISGDLHGSMTDSLIAALTAEPETVKEFETALHRYLKSESDWPPLHGFKRNENLEPYDAGIVAIDLASRTVGFETTYSLPVTEGSVRIPSEFADENEDIYIPYQLPGDWKFVDSIPAYKGACCVRREQRESQPPFDPRRILYGRPLMECIVRSIAEANDLDDENLVADTHARWLMTPRDDLRGKTPREVLLEKRDFLSFDLHTRSLQWSFTKVCPPPLTKDSHAYINAGIGMHEWVLYYDLIRHLLYYAIERRMSGDAGDLEGEVERLKKARDEWMRSPDSESMGRVPLEVIDLERRRINITMSAKDILIDENCPCCVALAEDFDTPMFWFLDGCNMDDRFEFSDFKTRDEYEAEIRSREEFDREWERKRKQDPDGKWWEGDGPF